jgi:hypothetical protein
MFYVSKHQFAFKTSKKTKNKPSTAAMTTPHMLLLLLGQNVAASGLVGPGAVTTYGGGGGGRSRGYGYVQDPAKGFFITGSTLEGGDFSSPPAKGFLS